MNRMFKFAHRPALTVAAVAMLSTSLLLVASPASADARSHLTDPTPETDSRDAIPNRAVMMQMNIVSTDDDALAAAARKSSETIQRYPSATTDPHSAIIEIKDGTSPFAVRAGMASIDADIAEFWETADAARVVSSNSVYLLERVRGLPFVSNAASVSKTLTSGYGTEPRDISLWGISGGAGIDSVSAQPDTLNLTDIPVAVIDTGVDISHEDLAGRLWSNPGEIPWDGVDNDSNGFIDDIHGWDFVCNLPYPRPPIRDSEGALQYDDAGRVVTDMASCPGSPAANTGGYDPHGHGTHVAGTIAAQSDNNTGISGVAPNARIAVLRTLGDSGSGWSSAGIAALNYAVENGIEVSNNSYGCLYCSLHGYSPMLMALNAHPEHVFLAAAGNDNLLTDTGDHYPSGLEGANVISVGSHSSSAGRSGVSNYGVEAVDVSAPGSFIMSTFAGDYYYMSGTSMATPHVAGMAVIMKGLDGSLTGGEVKDILMETSTAVAGFETLIASGGIVNLPDALTEISASSTPTTTTTIAPEGTTTTTVPTSTTTPPTTTTTTIPATATTTTIPTTTTPVTPSPEPEPPTETEPIDPVDPEHPVDDRVDTVPGKRIFDSRDGGAGRLPEQTVRYVQIAGIGDIPSDATVATINFTVVNPSGWGFVTAWGCDNIADAKPDASILNYDAGWTRANTQTIGLGNTGGICMWSYTDTDVIVDTQGYLTSNGITMHTKPVRVMNARGSSSFTSGEVRKITVAGSNLTAAFVNLTAVDPAEWGFLTAWPCATNSDPVPDSSAVNYDTGATVANNAVVALTDGGFCVYSYGDTGVLVDVMGVIDTTDTSVTPLDPARLVDTRVGGATSDRNYQGAGRFAAGETRMFTISGRSGIAEDATGVYINVTSVNPHGHGGFLTVWACSSPDDAPPNTSVVNYTQGWSATPNSVLQQLSEHGNLCVYAYKATDVLIDVTGYVT